MTQLKITPPARPESQTARISLNLTPHRKRRLEAAAKHYGTSSNSMVNQIIDGSLALLMDQDAGLAAVLESQGLAE